MILWTIRNMQSWEKLQEEKILHGDGRHVCCEFREQLKTLIYQYIVSR